MGEGLLPLPFSLSWNKSRLSRAMTVARTLKRTLWRTTRVFFSRSAIMAVRVATARCLQRKMVCWLGAMPRPRRLLPPLEGGGGQPCTGLLVVLPPVRKSPVRRACCACCRGAQMCRKDSGHGGGAGRAQMHGADAPAHGAGVCHVRDRPTERRARCLCAPASLLCVGCRCDVQCGAVRVDALGAVLPVQVQ